MRSARRLTLDDLAIATGITRGQLSKIENGRVSAPLSTLKRIADALDTEPALLLRRMDGAGFHFLTHEHQCERRDALSQARRNHERLFPAVRFESTFETMHVRLRGDADLKTYQYPGAIFIQVLQGKVVFRFGEEEISMQALDILYCDGRVDHGPIRLLETPTDYLIIFGEPRE